MGLHAHDRTATAQVILLDTHVWYWSVVKPGKLTRKAARAVRRQAEGATHLSIVSVFELATLKRAGRIEIDGPFREWLDRARDASRVVVAPLTEEIAVRVTRIGEAISDPADCAIVATALELGVPLVTADAAIIDSGYVKTIW